jgi:anti-sigma factor RsiW
MKTEPTNGPDFKAWRDIEPPGDFTQNVMRRIRTQPAREPGWRQTLAAFLSSRAAFAGSLTLSLIVAVLAFRAPLTSSQRASLEPNSLIVAYAKLTGGK